MKEWLKEFGRSVLQKVIILGSIALGVTVIIFLFTRPAISESILDTVTLEDGHFSVDGLYAGMTRDDVAAYLDAQKLVYFDGQTIVYPEDTPKSEFFRNALGTSWISLADETRITELGSTTVRRTYYFRDGALTHIDFETDVAKGKITDDIGRAGNLIAALKSAFGPAAGPDLKEFAETPGDRVFTWYGGENSELSVSLQKYQIEDWVKSYSQAKNNEKTYTDYFDVTIRVIL